MKSMQRLFIAIPLSDGVRGNVQRLQQELQPTLPGFRWLRATTLHLTLKFIGDVPVASVHKICELAAEAAEGIEPFGFRLQGLGAFPDPQRAKVLWIGASGELDPVRMMAERLDDAAQAYGVRPERKTFRPHVTIARSARGSISADAVEEHLERHATREVGKVFVRELVTYCSTLSREGSEYDVLARAKLGR